MNTKNSQELYKKAKGIIPGATQLLSKRAERFLPVYWPSYYEHAKGCEVWDIDGNHYYDFATMGIGACSLGYADKDINAAVIEAVNKGSMCTLNCPEEIELAELLITLHPWADMVRYARTGGEACAIAVRIARAATNKTKIAFCGYHGWHDWYISANLEHSNNLDFQLLPNMTTKGVPKQLSGTALPFRYNDPQSLYNIFTQHGEDIAAIIFELQRGTAPSNEYLCAIQEMASRYGCVIICDEVTSGFRMNIGGIHMHYDFVPDISVFGKTISNGFPMSAVIGKRSVMDYAQDSFISSAFWTERIGPVAALATIKKMMLVNSPAHLIKYGDMINECWKSAAYNEGIDIHISGIPPLTHLQFNYPNSDELQTYYTQIMLDSGFLVGPSVYTTYAYSDDIINKFSISTREAFKAVKRAIDENCVPIISPEPRSDAFKRLVY